MRRMAACFFLVVLAAFSAEPGAFAPHRWRVAKPVSHDNLTVYPVLSDQTWDTSAFLTLDEGLASGKVQVIELGGGAQVNRLALVNRSGRPLILLAGEIIIGGKQDRMVSHDCIVLPGEDPVIIEVFCVEPGRWHGRQSSFGALKAIVNPTVREQAVAYKSQQGVWARGGETTDRLMAGRDSQPGRGVRRGPTSASTSYARIYSSPEVSTSLASSAEALQSQYEAALRVQLRGKQVVGVVVAINNQPVWTDVFAGPALFEKYWPKLLRSYVVEAVARRGQAETGNTLSAAQFLEQTDNGRMVEKKDSAFELTRSQAGATLTYELFSRAPGQEGPLHFTRFR